MTSPRNEVAPNVARGNTQKENQKKHYRFQRPLPCALRLDQQSHRGSGTFGNQEHFVTRCTLSLV